MDTYTYIETAYENIPLTNLLSESWYTKKVRRILISNSTGYWCGSYNS